MVEVFGSILHLSHYHLPGVATQKSWMVSLAKLNSIPFHTDHVWNRFFLYIHCGGFRVECMSLVPCQSCCAYRLAMAIPRRSLQQGQFRSVWEQLAAQGANSAPLDRRRVGSKRWDGVCVCVEQSEGLELRSVVKFVQGAFEMWKNQQPFGSVVSSMCSRIIGESSQPFR